MGEKGLPITQPAFLKCSRPPKCAHTHPERTLSPNATHRWTKQTEASQLRVMCPCTAAPACSWWQSLRAHLQGQLITLPSGRLVALCASCFCPPTVVFSLTALRAFFSSSAQTALGTSDRSGGSRTGHLQALGLGHPMLGYANCRSCVQLVRSSHLPCEGQGWMCPTLLWWGATPGSLP